MNSPDKRERYIRLLKKLIDDPLGGLTRSEMKWLQEYEDQYPEDEIVKREVRNLKALDDFVLDIANIEGGEALGFSSDIQSREKRLEVLIQNYISTEDSSLTVKHDLVKNLPRLPIRPAAVAVLILLLGIISIIYLSKRAPEIPLISKLTTTEVNDLDLDVRGQSPFHPEIVKGAASLLKANGADVQQKIDTLAAREAVAHFASAFEQLTDPAKKNYAAYFCARGYLMLNDQESGCFWLSKVLQSKAVDFQDKAKSLSIILECKPVKP